MEETFRIELDQLLREEELDNLAPFMAPSLFAEAPLYSQDAQVSFLDGLPIRQRNTILIRFAVNHLKTIILYRAEHFAARDDDFVAMVSIMGWEHHDPEVDLLIPYLWSANPSKLELTGALLNPPTSRCSTFVAEALGNDPAYAIHEGYHSGNPPYLDRVYIRPVTMSVPPIWLTGGPSPR